MRLSQSLPVAFVTAIILALGCGGNGKGDGNGDGADSGADNGDGGADNGDGGNNGGDGGPIGCTASGTQCNNCIDDDSDGLIDGFDPECISALDDREDSFATGIPGDNRDAVKQDCFFDGDSGAGNDGCDIHVCCLLDVEGTGECPDDLRPDQYDPNDCTPTQECIDNCQPLTPPGCDCFSCCTVCVDGVCRDILTHPETAPDCDQDVVDNPDLCPPCVKVEECSNDCDGDPCTLCPGQTQDDLPPECNGDNVCPNDLTPCDTTDDCQVGEFCSAGCCIIQVD